MIFDKLRDEGFVPATEEVRLTVEILVPSSQVGRIIGRGGSNVRELQRVTGSIIKLPTQGSTDGTEDTTTVHIIGHFLATQVSIMMMYSFFLIINTVMFCILVGSKKNSFDGRIWSKSSTTSTTTQQQTHRNTTTVS